MNEPTSVTPAPVTAADLAACWRRLREDSPLVQCLTNIVVAPFTANVLLAAGASPAMVDNPHEAASFARIASAVLVNLGTPYDDTTEAMRAAVGTGTPWVLDPVAAGGLPWRTELAHELLRTHPPTVVRANASEILGLTGGTGGRGVDSLTGTDEVTEVAADLARRHGCVVAVSGEVDLITDGSLTLRIPHGHVLMTKVTGVGCALGALLAACVGCCENPVVAAATATAALTLAAEAAASTCAGPGSFAVRLLDELAAFTPQQLESSVRLS